MNRPDARRVMSAWVGDFEAGTPEELVNGLRELASLINGKLVSCERHHGGKIATIQIPNGTRLTPKALNHALTRYTELLGIEKIEFQNNDWLFWLY